MSKRFFWRRAFALLIDIIIFTQIAFFLVLPFADNTNVRLSNGLIKYTSCASVDPEQIIIDNVVHQAGADITSLYCTRVENFIDVGDILLTVFKENHNGTIFNRKITVAVDDNGLLAEPIYPVQNLSLVIFLAGMVLLTWKRRGRTIGKQLLGIRVQNIDETPLSLKTSVLREIYKYAALSGWIIASILVASCAADVMTSSEVSISGFSMTLTLVFIIGLLPVFVLWILPLLRWRGSMPYDRWAKTQVTRA